MADNSPELFVYLGSEGRFYTQYLDVTPGEDGEMSPRPLEAEPGHEYAMQLVPGWFGSDLRIPPADGLWTGVTPRGEKAAPVDKKGASK